MPPRSLHYPNRRRQRAQHFVAQVMRVVAKHLDSGVAAKSINAQLYELFTSQGMDVVTDLDRANVGLPVRDDYGWTDDELRELETARINAMFKPVPGPDVLIQMSGRQSYDEAAASVALALETSLAEREACAQIAEMLGSQVASEACLEVAKRIRAQS